MYIIHIVVLYFVLLKLRLDYEIPRNFNMIPVMQADAKFVMAHIYCAASVWGDAIWDLESSLRMRGNQEWA